jgi:glycosyltransferase involved in cell wall biosynthesis
MMQCDEIKRLKKIAEEENIADKIIFAGRKNRGMLKYYYSAADIFVTTPWYEPFGITPLESMACGTPVIGADVGGIKYSIVHNETGFLVPPKQPAVLAEKINFLLTRPSELQRMKENAIARVNTIFTWSTVSAAIAALYESVLSNGAEERLNYGRANAKLAPVINLKKEKSRVRKLRL